ncbi:hypothetical protein FQA39_LY14225 [Lamprigera yunnana]|nr:hypothetical protein FQA39_LY14225 [Lamprigera yunnana]
MILIKYFKKILINNVYVFLGILLGALISCYLNDGCKLSKDFKAIDSSLEALETNAINKPIGGIKKPIKKAIFVSKEGDKLVRPHYLSTELSIRDKLFVGVLTSEDKINTQAIYINKTITHLVDKVKFFITAHHKMKNTFNLTGIVGFTDNRHKYRPFQIIKYIGDSFIQGYDYYFLMNDYDYLNVRKLKKLVEKVSVSNDVYLGTLIEDGSYCNLGNNSVVQAVKSNLDWCITNAVSDDSSENLGRCVYYSTNLECQDNIKGYSLPSYKLKHFQLEKHLGQLTKRKSFNHAIIIYPILQAKDFHILNAYFARCHLEKLKMEIDELAKYLTESWPSGQRVAARPATRFDVLPQLYFNMSHVFFPNDFTNFRSHSLADILDIEKVIKLIKDKVMYEHADSLQYRRLINGYKRFDLSRGMEYIFDLGFRDLHTGKEVIKRFEVCKPLGKIEFIPAPYVTENVKVAILLPVQETEDHLAHQFLLKYDKVIMKRKEKVLLMLVLVYQYNSPSKGSADIFGELKLLATKLSNKYRHDDLRVIWVSIRLPFAKQRVMLYDFKVLNFAMIDLALKKVGTEALTLVLDVYTDITTEFLNRVRMNTVSNFQVFSPIPFRQYNPNVTRTDAFEVKKAIGHFDHEEYRYISFYGRDYVAARKRAQLQVPLIRNDNDIVKIMNNTSSGNVYELFVNYSDNLHCMRATEKDLKVRYHEEGLMGRYNLFFGTKLQLAKVILDFQNVIDVVYK